MEQACRVLLCKIGRPLQEQDDMLTLREVRCHSSCVDGLKAMSCKEFCIKWPSK